MGVVNFVIIDHAVKTIDGMEGHQHMHGDEFEVKFKAITS